MLSMDANFGLVRKKSSGSSVTKPKHLGHFFTPQEQVDEFVAKQNSKGKKTDVSKAAGIKYAYFSCVTYHNLQTFMMYVS